MRKECTAAVVEDEQLGEYDFGPQHPLSPVRQVLTMRLAREFGLLDAPNVTLLSDIEVLGDADLERVHTRDLIEAVKLASDDPSRVDEAHGLGTPDDPTFPQMHRAAARICGASVAAARSVLEGTARHAVNLYGGLHHAMPDYAAGFCVYNDPAVAIRWLLDRGVSRIAYIDVDVHHGDGVQKAFWDEPRVMTLSIHESPATLFPGTGWPTEVGGPRALGTSVNLALPAGTGDQGWLRGLHAVFPALLQEFRPEIIVSQHGCDGHFEDPLASMALTVDGLRMSAEAIHRWAHRYAGGRWLALGGGGYEWVDVVPRVWTNVVAEASGRPIEPNSPLPQPYLDFVRDFMNRESPVLMTDGATPWPKSWELGYDSQDPVDAAIVATRTSLFPLLGIPTGQMFGF